MRCMDGNWVSLYKKNLSAETCCRDELESKIEMLTGVSW